MMKPSNRLVAAAAAAALIVPTWAWAQGTTGPRGYGYGSHMMGWDGGWFGMIFGPLFMIFLLAAAIALVVFLARWLGGPWHGTQSQQVSAGRAPLDILKERFARGEIDKDEFEERRRVLGD